MSNSQIKDTFTQYVDDPEKRFAEFFKFYCDVKINAEVSADKYLRSGKEVMRMAIIYLQEKDYLYAFVLLTRYSLLYLEKIKSHPSYSSLNKTELADHRKQAVNSALPKAEKLKSYIKELFAYEANVYKQEQEDKLREVNNENKKPELEAMADADVHCTDGFDLNTSIELSSLATSKYGLRALVLPANISEEFLRAAAENTQRNVETCGMLAGKLKQNTFFVSHCVISKQSGDSESCITECENEIFDVMDRLELITLGWIHTHPSQSAFLSSVDLHTQFSYQIMVPEAIAIVCAPSTKENGIFNLTPYFGLKYIGDCKQNGFHKHETAHDLFETCGHVHFDSKLNIDMIDLRLLQ